MATIKFCAPPVSSNGVELVGSEGLCASRQHDDLAFRSLLDDSDLLSLLCNSSGLDDALLPVVPDAQRRALRSPQQERSVLQQSPPLDMDATLSSWETVCKRPCYSQGRVDDRDSFQTSTKASAVGKSATWLDQVKPFCQFVDRETQPFSSGSDDNESLSTNHDEIVNCRFDVLEPDSPGGSSSDAEWLQDLAKLSDTSLVDESRDAGGWSHAQDTRLDTLVRAPEMGRRCFPTSPGCGDCYRQPVTSQVDQTYAKLPLRRTVADTSDRPAEPSGAEDAELRNNSNSLSCAFLQVSLAADSTDKEQPQGNARRKAKRLGSTVKPGKLRSGKVESKKEKNCARERRRQTQMNKGYANLCATLPSWVKSRNARLTKVKVLRYACRYIAWLAKTLDDARHQQLEEGIVPVGQESTYLYMCNNISR